MDPMVVERVVTPVQMEPMALVWVAATLPALTPKEAAVPVVVEEICGE